MILKIKMKEHIVEIAGTAGGVLTALFIKIPFMENGDLHKLAIVVLGGALSAVTSWFIKRFLNKLDERHEDKKRRDEW